MPRSSFLDHFSVIADERQYGKVKHQLISILFIAVAGAVSGCNDFEEIVYWAGLRESWIRKFVPLPNGIPSVATFGRVFRLINSEQFERCFIGWMRDIAKDCAGQTVAIDGKTLRGAKSAIHIVSALSSEYGLSLGEVKTNEKSNELTAIPCLLKLLSIDDAIVTIDAMGTQTDIARQIVEDNHAEYVLALKMNQLSMYRDAVLLFTGVDLGGEWLNPADAEELIREAVLTIPNLLAANDGSGLCAYEDGNPPLPFLGGKFEGLKSVDKGHGRAEQRLYVLVDDIDWLSRRDEWNNLKSLGMALNISTDLKTGIRTADIRFFICSITDCGQFARSVRQHWGIESMHWTLDVTFGEDKSRIRKDNAPQNMALLRKVALNILKEQKRREPPEDKKLSRRSYKVRRLNALMSEEYLEKVMIGNFQ